MKKRPAKTKASAKARPAAKVSAARSAPKMSQAPKTSRVAGYTPPPLKSDGWPPFRYPVQ